MWLRVSQWVYAGKVIGNLLGCRRLEKDVGVLAALECGRERVCRLIEGFGRDNGGRQGRRFIEVLQERPAEGYDGVRSIDGYPREQREVLAAMYVGTEMRRGGVCEKDEGECRDMSGASRLVEFDIHIVCMSTSSVCCS